MDLQIQIGNVSHKHMYLYCTSYAVHIKQDLIFILANGEKNVIEAIKLTEGCSADVDNDNVFNATCLSFMYGSFIIQFNFRKAFKSQPQCCTSYTHYCSRFNQFRIESFPIQAKSTIFRHEKKEVINKIASARDWVELIRFWNA